MNTDRDLITFINQEKKIEKISNRQILVYFNKCFKKSIKELDSKFINIKNKQNNVLAGLNMLYHIFVVLLCYFFFQFFWFMCIDRFPPFFRVGGAWGSFGTRHRWSPAMFDPAICDTWDLGNCDQSMWDLAICTRPFNNGELVQMLRQLTGGYWGIRGKRLTFTGY